MKKVTFFTKYNPPPSPALECKDASLTRQEFVQESDLNNIMKRYAAGIPLPSGTRPPQFGDFSNVPDYAESFELVEKASDLFAKLSSEIRLRFDNDPRKLLAFLNDSKNRDEAIKLGLIENSSENSSKSSTVQSTVSPTVQTVQTVQTVSVPET